MQTITSTEPIKRTRTGKDNPMTEPLMLEITHYKGTGGPTRWVCDNADECKEVNANLRKAINKLHKSSKELGFIVVREANFTLALQPIPFVPRVRKA